MAFIAPLAAANPIAFNLALAAVGIGLQLGAAYFFPQKIKGPRAESTKAQTSKYGDPIARVHGTGRTAGAVIWLKDDHVDEHKETERQGGKGIALGPEVTTYTYSADFAVAFAWNGPAAGIPRIWADDKLILDNSAESLEEILNGNTEKGIGVAKGATIKVYLGTQDQEADPDIEADRGVGAVPAWPGIVYMVIKNFPLDEFGIRLPNIEAEVVMAGDMSFTALNITGDSSATDVLGKTLVSGNGVFNVYSLPAFVLVATHSIPVASPATSNGTSPYITQRGDIAIAQRFSIFFGGTRYVHFYDGAGAGFLQTVEAPGTGLNNLGTFCDITIDGINYLFLHDHPDLVCFTSEVVPETENPEEVAPGEWSYAWINSTMAMSTVGGCFSAGPDFLYFLSSDGDDIFIIDWPNTTSANDTLVSPPGLIGDPIFISYDAETDSVFIETTTGIFAYNPELDDLLASNTDATFFTGLTSGGNIPNQPRIDGPTGSGTIIIRHNGSSGPVGDVIQLNKSDLTEVERWTTAESSPDWPNIGVGGYWASSPEWGFLWATGFTGQYAFFLPRLAPDLIPLAQIIEDECGFVDLPNDVTAITGLVIGYVAREVTAPRGVIEDLQRVKFFDFTQDGGITKFFMRSSTAVRSLTIPADLGFAEGQVPSFWVRENYQDIEEIPRRVVIDYPSHEADYREGSQSIAAPEGSTEADSQLQYQTSLIMTDDEAAQSADILYNEILDAGSSYQFRTGPKFLELHPGDVINLDLEDELRTIKAVVTRQEGEAGMTFDALFRSTIYSSEAVGMPTPNNPQTLLGIARIGQVLIDGHLMRAEDDGTGFYVGIYAAESGRFSSGTIYKSNDLGGSYAPWLSFTAATLRGIAADALPDVDHAECWDYASTLTFTVVNTKGVPSKPASVSEEALLADAELNAFAVKAGTDWEYVQAASVSGNTDGTWTISTLLRGRKGTDFATGGHAIGDTVIYLDPNAMDRPPDGEKGLERVYAPIATSTVFTSQYAQHFTNAARGQRPWAPWGVTAARDASGNITLDWFRRDRLGQEWPEGGPEDPPMSETSESYQVYIYSVSAGVLRTITATTSTAPYSAADQTTDFGAPVPVDELMVGVVQMSSTFGAGVERLATV